MHLRGGNRGDEPRRAHDELVRGNTTRIRRRTLDGKRQSIPPRAVYGAAALILLLLTFFIRQSRRPGWWTTLALLAIPVLMALCVAIRGKHANENLVAGAFVVSIVSNQLPRWITALVAALVAAAFSLATRPAHDTTNAIKKNGSSSSSSSSPTDSDGRGMQLKTKTVLSCLFMIGVLLHENFQVWVVSATYPASHEPPYPEALQDNGRIVMRKLAEMASLQRRDVQALRDAFNVQWALVSAAIAGGLVGCELKLGRASHRSMWAVGMRALLTLGIARFVRTVSFLLTVLPSQMPSCYRSHYPYPVPDTWSEWIMVGLKPAARGGCNDLIISGHATVTSVLACVGVSVADNALFSVAVWSLLAFDYLVEVYQGYHYSVDMWMGAVLTSLIFRSLASVEPQVVHGEENKYLPMSSNSVRDVILYVAPALLAFVIITVSREAIANLWIVIYVLTAAMAQIKGDAHFSRHIFVCTLYIALIVYL
eukprot:CAMPEP_0181071812 /NCGR_PEP_ID=MMETSP1070-20121207/28244_1 /TAXON_ID=265543 /ORGANISM="Minutocellus polymorphus, Strain NH13" /LENGTH=480 /DNA_ID=CAMNT_0023152839 /DNA_START=95 /DNA_END=1537 /DNA_ORIENTATION=+